MYEENGYYYDSDENSFEDFDDDELDEAEKNYLSEENIDNLIHTIRMYGSEYHYPEIEELIHKTNEESVFQWFQVFQLIRDPTGSKIQTFNEIEALLDAQNLRLKKTNSTLTPPHKQTPESAMLLHEKAENDIHIDNKEDATPEYISILPPSNIPYYDLSPYINTAVVFQHNLAQLKDEITRILIESSITEPLLMEEILNNELKTLTGYDPRLFLLPRTTATSAIQTISIQTASNKLPPTILTPSEPTKDRKSVV